MSEIPGLGTPPPSDLTINPTYEELVEQVAILEARNAGLRGLSTPGLVVEALEEIRATAAQGLAVAEKQVVFWTVVGEWATKLVTDEREEWGDLLKE